MAKKRPAGKKIKKPGPLRTNKSLSAPSPGVGTLRERHLILDEKRQLSFIVPMGNFKKITALVLLGLLTLILAGTGTGIHIHHENHGFDKSTHAAVAHDTDGDSCTQHCEGEPLLEHFLENHGSLFIDKTILFIAPLAAVMYILPVSLTYKNTVPKPSTNHETIPGHQYLSGTAPGRAPPFSA